MIPIAYLTSKYPALSHTFVRREIAALRERGLDVRPFSVRPGDADWGEDVPAILGRGKMRVLIDALSAAMAKPVPALQTFVLSQQHRDKGLRGWLWSLFHYLEALSLASLLRRVGAGHLHSHFANSGATVGMLAAHYLGIPWSLTLHGISETDPPAGALLPDKIRRAQFVACASWFMRAQGMRLVEPTHWSKMHLVRCGVDLPTGVRTDTSGPVRKFVTVGRLSAEKGYPGLLWALQQVRARFPDVSLTVIGDGPLRPDVEDHIRKEGLADCVTLLGGLPEDRTLAEIASADAFILASLMEGLPVVLMEAMAAGKPVIAPTVAGIPELVRDDETGLLFRPSDWAHLAEQMALLLSQDGMAARLGAAARARVAEEFVIDSAVDPLPLLFAQSQPCSSSPLAGEGLQLASRA